jgi:hypothetical protein
VPQMPQPDANCPSCGRMDMTKSIPAIYAEGTARTSMMTTGTISAVGVGRDQVGFGTGRITSRSTGLQQTALARRLAPPGKYSYRFKVFTMLAIIGVFGGVLLDNYLRPLPDVVEGLLAVVVFGVIPLAWLSSMAHTFWFHRRFGSRGRLAWQVNTQNWWNATFCSRCNAGFCTNRVVLAPDKMGELVTRRLIQTSW